MKNNEVSFAEKHPKLKEKNVIEWDDEFLNYDKIVKFLNSNFNMNILSEEYVYVLSFNCRMEILGVFQLSHGNSIESKIGMRELGNDEGFVEALGRLLYRFTLDNNLDKIYTYLEKK